MHHLGVAGAELERDHHLVLDEAGGNDEIAVDVLAVGRHREGLGHPQHQVRLTEAPLGVRTERDRHGVVGIAQPGAVLGPGCEERDLVVAEAARIAERAEVGHRPPRRHEPLAGHEGDHAVPAFRVVVAFERKRGDAAISVTFDAVGFEQRRDVAVVGDLVEPSAVRARPVPDMVEAPDCLRLVGLWRVVVRHRGHDSLQVVRGDPRA